MQVDELYRLTKWISEHVSGAGIPKKYQQLTQKLEQNRQRNQDIVPFEEEQTALREALVAVPLHSLTDAQSRVLSSIGIKDYVGEQGAEFVEDVLFRNAIDVANAAQKIQHAKGMIDGGINWSNSTASQLKSIAPDEDIDELEPGEILIRIRFAEAAKISNVEELKAWSRIWWEIVRGITMLHGRPPESVAIVGASKGSILFDLVGCAAFASVLLTVINGSLKATERIQNIRLTQQQIRSFKFKNENVERELSAALEQERVDRIRGIVTEVTASLAEQHAPDGEVLNALENSIKQLVEFIEKGGHVDFVVPNPGDDADESDGDDERAEINEIRQMAEEVRTLENKIKLLEDRSTEP